MYIPKAFREDRTEVLHDFIRRYNFAALITFDGGEMTASHLPFILDSAPAPHGALRCHVSRANPQWSSFSAEIPALVIFSGPHHYISPSWYPSKAEHGRVVPTWNYAAVHAYGRLRKFEDPVELRRIVDDLTRVHESAPPQPWTASDAPPEFIAGLTQAIVGLEMTIDKLEGKWKFGQNRSESDREGAAAALRRLATEPAREVAELMQRTCRTRIPAN